MTANKRRSDLKVLTGTHFMSGDEACAEGAVAAGCTFFAGYPSALAVMLRVGGGDVKAEDAFKPLKESG